MAPITKEEALKNALASSSMEGFPVSPEIVRNCRRLLNGKADVDTLIRELLEQER